MKWHNFRLRVCMYCKEPYGFTQGSSYFPDNKTPKITHGACTKCIKRVVTTPMSDNDSMVMKQYVARQMTHNLTCLHYGGQN